MRLQKVLLLRFNECYLMFLIFLVLSNVVPINHKLMFEKAKPINVSKKLVIPAAQNLQADQASEVSSTTPDFIKVNVNCI